MPFLTRLWFSYVCFFAVLCDGVFASRVKALRTRDAELPPERPERDSAPPPAAPQAADPSPALQLLALLQREGRFVDFVQQDVEGFSDADIAAAARVVHAGCRQALRAHGAIEPVRTEAEGADVTVDTGFDSSAIKLTGNVAGSPPYRGTLRHRGWRAASFELPRPVGTHDATVLAPAEVEL
jgi:hypothetical protein